MIMTKKRVSLFVPMAAIVATSVWVTFASIASPLFAQEDPAAGQSAEYRLEKNIPYYDRLTLPEGFVNGDDAYRAERCKLDLYLPPSPSEGEKTDVKPFAVIVWFHGGGLSGGGKHIPDGFREKGIGVAAVNYRLSSDRAKSPDYLVDAAAAVAWTLDHIADYGGDPKRVYLSGHSAGGYLSAMLGLAPKWLGLFGKSNLDLAGVFPISGQMTTHFQILNERYGRDLAPSNPAEIDEMAPLHFTTKKAPPIHLLVGDPKIEWPGRVEENALLAAMLRLPKDHGVVEYRSFPDTNHGTVLNPSVDYIVENLTK